MILQADDLPPGFILGEESFGDNGQAAAGSDDREALLEEWGRLLGYDVIYQPGSAEALEESPVKGINVSASLYRTEEGAGDSFADARKTADTTDWAANYTGLEQFQQEEIEVGDLADEIVWLHLSGFQPTSSGPNALVTDDLIFFRIDNHRGFLRVLGSSTETEDRQHLRDTVDGWLRTLVQKVKDALAEGGFNVMESE